MRFEFSAVLWRWAARTELWTFVSVPPEAAEEIAELAATLPRAGFGAVRVTATIGGSRWRTSIFPVDDPSAGGSYSLPVSARIRKREGLGLGDDVRVAIELVDF